MSRIGNCAGCGTYPSEITEIRKDVWRCEACASGTKPVQLAIGQLWRAKRGPWPSDKPPVRIVDLLDGWVRYYVNDHLADERMTEEQFRSCYAERVQEAPA